MNETTQPTPTPTPSASAALAGALQGQSVVVLGLGASGLAMARWCQRLGAAVTVADTRAQPPQLPRLHSALPTVRFVHSAFDAALLDRAGSPGAVFVSPGLAPAQTAAVLGVARQRGLWVGGELALFAHALQRLQQAAYAPRVLAVTGTNGKTTVTALTGHLLAWVGQRVAVAGNIGPTLLDTLAEALTAEALPETWVLELSSFQLALPCAFEPTAATVLNLTQDHLDWHPDMADYAAAKARIFGQQGLMVLNRDDPAVLAMLPTPAKGRSLRTHITFGAGLPTRGGDFGLEAVNGMTWLVRAHPGDETQRRKRQAAPEELFLQRLMPADALRIRGRHNACNALAALALASATGAPLAQLLFGLREYRGEPHRVQPVGIVHEIEYFDDSKGTNVGATVAALQGLGSERKVVVILGGEGKGQDFTPLADPVQRFARAVVLIGRDAPLIRQALQSCTVPLHDARSMAEAVREAAAQARSGDAVLLSPACASFDMFDDYAHRARAFVAAVQDLASDAGTDLGGGA